MHAELEDWNNGWHGLRLSLLPQEISRLIELLQDLQQDPEQHFHISSDYSEFVTEALLQISGGIEDAQRKLQEGCSTTRINTSMTKDDTGNLVTGGRRHAIEYVEFDVAILASSGTETKAGVGLTVVSLLNLSAGGRSNESKGMESRIKFRVPVAFPKHRYPEQDQ